MNRTKLMNKLFSDKTSSKYTEQFSNLVEKAKKEGSVRTERFSMAKVNGTIYVEDKKFSEVTAIEETDDEYQMRKIDNSKFSKSKESKKDETKSFSEVISEVNDKGSYTDSRFSAAKIGNTIYVENKEKDKVMSINEEGEVKELKDEKQFTGKKEYNEEMDNELDPELEMVSEEDEESGAYKESEEGGPEDRVEPDNYEEREDDEIYSKEYSTLVKIKDELKKYSNNEISKDEFLKSLDEVEKNFSSAYAPNPPKKDEIKAKKTPDYTPPTPKAKGKNKVKKVLDEIKGMVKDAKQNESPKNYSETEEKDVDKGEPKETEEKDVDKGEPKETEEKDVDKGEPKETEEKGDLEESKNYSEENQVESERSEKSDDEAEDEKSFSEGSEKEEKSEDDDIKNFEKGFEPANPPDESINKTNQYSVKRSNDKKGEDEDDPVSSVDRHLQSMSN